MKELSLELKEQHPPAGFSAGAIREAVTAWLTKELAKSGCAPKEV